MIYTWHWFYVTLSSILGNVTVVSSTMNPGYGPGYGQGYGPSYGAPQHPNAPYPPQKAGFDQSSSVYPPPGAY